METHGVTNYVLRLTRTNVCSEELVEVLKTKFNYYINQIDGRPGDVSFPNAHNLLNVFYIVINSTMIFSKFVLKMFRYNSISNRFAFVIMRYHLSDLK